MIKRILRGAKSLLAGDLYGFRRGAVWPEPLYKQGMLVRVQKTFAFPYFVETGTYYGETAKRMSRFFEKVWTIELNEQLYTNATAKLAENKNVTCVFGNSGAVLAEVVKQLDKPALFFLDSHYSGGDTANSKNPILKELRAIRESSLKGHAIVIDDASDFCMGGPAVFIEVLRAIQEIDQNYKIWFDYDMMFALPGNSMGPDFFWRKIAYPFVIR